MLPFRLALIAAALSVPLVAASCGGSVDSAASSSGGSRPDASGGGGSGAGQPGDDAGAGGEPDAGCVLTSLPLIVERQADVPVRLHASIRYQDAPAVLLVDTGSQLTFLNEPPGSPDPVPDAATFQLGCLDLEVIGRPELADPPVNGVPSVGLLGIDLLTRGPTQLDFKASRILFHQPGAPFSGAAGWPSTAFDLLSGSVVTRVSLDGTPVRLIVDTGSQDTLWVGQQPKPGDIEEDTTDAYGNPLKVYLGTVDLELGGVHRTVPILRAPTFPNYHPPAPDITGLLGLSSLGAGFVLDTDASLVRVDF